MQDEKIKALREWMIKQGCKIHPNITIPSSINGVQGISTNNPIPHRTLIVAIPSKLILTVSKCYNDPKLKKLFLGNDDLFDYQSSQDAQFNVLCVFLMYHKINIQTSQWKEYLDTISQPQTAIDWSHSQLKGLNKSIIQEIIHVQIQCNKLQQELLEYLSKRKQFSKISQDILRRTFHYCYRSVLTRCFGYYFDETCLIPIADLINHHCQSVDHQLINVEFQLDSLGGQIGYDKRRTKMNVDLLGIESQQSYNLPFRQKFLVENKIIENKAQVLLELDRLKINELLCDWNEERLKRGGGIDDLNFCSQDENQDNDTDEQLQAAQIKELDYYKKTQEEQMGQFMNSIVKVERYRDVQSKLSQLNGEKSQKVQVKVESKTEQIHQNDEVKLEQAGTNLLKKQQQSTIEKQVMITQQSKSQPKKQQTQKVIEKEAKRQNPFSNAQGKGVPIQLMDSSSQDSSQDHNQWFLNQSSYFTMSTGSPIPANKEVFNSYGSRTNKFLLIWYGFTYPNNLYDSVSFRLQVQFNKLRPASQIVLDSYVGGQGLSFKKANLQVVKQNQISRQFRLKRSSICFNLITFLRLYLMNFYEQPDLYKLFITFPASIHYQLYIFNFYKQIVESLYERYPLEIIQELKNDYENPLNEKIKFKIKYKIVYLQEQRKLIDLNLEAVVRLIQILEKAKGNGGVLKREMYRDVDVRILRVIRKYLILYQSYTQYIVYRQEDKVEFRGEGQSQVEINSNVKQQCLNKGDANQKQSGNQQSE